MIGINFGSLNSSIALCRSQSQNSFKAELLLSETSSRTCPTIITFSNTQRLIGDQASLILKKNIKSSFQYLNRLIGFQPLNNFHKKEIMNYYFIGGEYNNEQNKFNYLINDNSYALSPEEVIISYLHLLYNSYILDKNIECDYLVFAVHDYFTCYQKNIYNKIIQSICINKNFSLINESSAITLYFGYKKYNEYFINKKINSESKIVSAEIDTTIIKYVLFIDAGHSKTSFILSKLTFGLFQVLDSITLPFLGGRDFDNKIYNFCIKKFLNDYGIDISNDNKIKLRLITSIMKARKVLTVNKDTNINIDSLKNDNDFSLKLTREEFEDLIKEELNLFKTELKKFLEKSEKNLNFMITNIEMAGELMRTPALQKIVKEITGLEMSKTILTDECISIGCSLYGAFLNKCFPIKNFTGIYHINHYTINMSINNGPLQKLVSNTEYVPITKFYTFDEKYFDNDVINIAFYYEKEEIDNYLSYNRDLLISYDFDCKEILKENGGIKNVKISFMINDIGDISIKAIESNVFENEYLSLKIEEPIFKIIDREIYPDLIQNKKEIDELINNEKLLFLKDQDYKNFSKHKNKILSKLFTIKNKVNENGISQNIYDGKKICDILDDYEIKLNEINDIYFDLESINVYLDNIVNSLLNDNLNDDIAKFTKKIINYQELLSEEYTKFLSGLSSNLNEEQINDASNMLEHFKNNLKFILNEADLQNIQNDFNTEIIKYFKN